MPLTQYSYRVRSVNGDSQPSGFSASTSTMTAPPSPPAAASGLGAEALSESSIRWTWSDHADNELGYRVMSGTANLSGNRPPGTVSWTQSGLLPGTSQQAFVQTFNDGGVSNSAPLSRYTLAAQPGAPTITGLSPTAVSLAWAPNGNPGGTGYELQRSQGGAYATVLTAPATYFADSGLQFATTYYYKVRAINGDGAATAFSTATAIRTPDLNAPTATNGFAGVSLAPGSILWSWSDEADNEEGYRVMSGTVSISGDLDPGTTHWLQTGLSANKPYGPYLVQGFNAAGTSDSGANQRYTLAAVPGMPTAIKTSSVAIEVGWPANGNPSETLFILERSTGGPYVAIFTGTGNSREDTPVEAFTAYSYRVLALNGDSIQTAYSAPAMLLSGLPEPPEVATGFSGAARSASSIGWSWTDKARNEDGYRVMRGTAVLAEVPNDNVWLEIGLSANTSYQAYARAFNVGGETDCEPAIRYTKALPPGTPVQQGVSSAAISIAWSAGGNPAWTVYEIQRLTGGDYSTVSTRAAASFADISVSPSRAYSYRVRALNGDSIATAYSGVLSVQSSPPASPAPPSVLPGVAVDSASIRWKWTDNSSDDDGYRVVSGTANLSGDLPAGTTSWLQTGLSPNTSYGPYRIHAFNAGGAAASAPSSIRYTLAAVPGSVDAGASSTMASLTWSASGNPAGTVYEVQRSTGGTFALVVGGTQVSFADAGLSAATTYYYRVRAFNAEAVATNFSSTAEIRTSDVNAPAPPTGFRPGPSVYDAASHKARLLWAWSDNATDEDGYRVMSGTTNISGNLPSDTGSWNQTDIPPNTLCGPYYVQAFGPGGASNSGMASRFSPCDPPGKPDAINISSIAFTLAWSSGVNPAGTVFELQRSTGGAFSTVCRAAVTQCADSALFPGTGYHYRVLAWNGDNMLSTPSDSWKFVVTPRAAPRMLPAPSAWNVGTDRISWSWPAVPDEATEYWIYQVSSFNQRIATSAASAFTQTGIVPGSRICIAVAGANESGPGPLSEPACVYTRPNAPSSTEKGEVYASSAIIRWSANGNSPEVLYEVFRSTDNFAFTRVYHGSSTATQFLDSDLAPCAEYWYKVRAVNAEALASDFNLPIDLRTAVGPPPPPSELKAESLADNRVTLSWSASPSDGITGYRLYFDGGTGTVDYTSEWAALSSTVTRFTSGFLAPRPAYRFAVRAVNRCGVTEANTNVRAFAGSLASLAGVCAGVKAPPGGRRIAGNRLTVMAAPTHGAESEARQVLFQYRPPGGGWRDIAAATAKHLNPDVQAPFFMHWDVRELDPGDYDLRAVATDSSGVEDPAPSAVTVTVDPVNFDIGETSRGGGEIQKVQVINNGGANSVWATAEGRPWVVQIGIPPGALERSTATITIGIGPVDAPAATGGLTAAGAVLEISLSNGQTLLGGGQRASLNMSYQDDNNDGIVDGTAVRARDVAVYSYDAAAGQWLKDVVSTVYFASHTVTAYTPHFSFFGLLGAPPAPLHAALNSLRVYPNPFKPNGGNADEGRPYSPSDPNSGIIFDNLPGEVTITIYTITGQRVARTSTASSGGRLQWDAKNDAGRDVASGGYFAVIASPGQTTEVKTIAIIR